MPKKSTYAITMLDRVAAKALGLDDHVRQVDYVGTFASKAAFVRAVLLVRPESSKSGLTNDTYDWGFRPEYVEENTLYVRRMLGGVKDEPILLRDITGTR